jgi:hypothetical protein
MRLRLTKELHAHAQTLLGQPMVHELVMDAPSMLEKLHHNPPPSAKVDTNAECDPAQERCSKAEALSEAQHSAAEVQQVTDVHKDSGPGLPASSRPARRKPSHLESQAESQMLKVGNFLPAQCQLMQLC